MTDIKRKRYREIPREKIDNPSKCTGNLDIGSDFKLFIIKMLKKSEEEVEIKCKCIEFQYRTSMCEKIIIDILKLKNTFKIPISEIKNINEWFLTVD